MLAPLCIRCCAGHLAAGPWGSQLGGQSRGQARSPGRKCLSRAAPRSRAQSRSQQPLCLAVELDRSRGHPEPHWKEFRFDLTQIPAGEALTAAEFRIYKLPSAHLLNRTLHISLFEVARERANRCLSPAPVTLGVSGPALGTDRLPGSPPPRGRMLGPRPWPLASTPPCCPGCGTLDEALSSQPQFPHLSPGAAHLPR